MIMQPRYIASAKYITHLLANYSLKHNTIKVPKVRNCIISKILRSFDINQRALFLQIYLV